MAEREKKERRTEKYEMGKYIKKGVYVKIH